MSWIAHLCIVGVAVFRTPGELRPLVRLSIDGLSWVAQTASLAMIAVWVGLVWGPLDMSHVALGWAVAVHVAVLIYGWPRKAAVNALVATLAVWIGIMLPPVGYSAYVTVGAVWTWTAAIAAWRSKAAIGVSV